MKQWIDIPIETKEVIVQSCTEKTRKSLRSVSFCNKQMVDWARINSIDCLSIWQIGEENLKITYPIPAQKKIDYEKKYGNFVDLQKALTAMLKSTHCIKILRINNVSSDLILENWKNGCRQRLRVECLKAFPSTGTSIKNILSQIEPVYLRKITLCSDEGDSTIYDMPQFVFAEEVSVGESIREDQLLKLNARHVTIHLGNPISLQKYIEKCTLTAHINLAGFLTYQSNAFSELKQIYSPNSNKVLLDTSHPQLKFELKFDSEGCLPQVEGSIRYESEKVASNFLYRDTSVLRAIDVLTIKFHPNNNCWKIDVSRKFHSEYTYELMSIEEFQTKLDEILENTDCINYLAVYGPAPAELDKKSKIGIQWKPRKNKLMVKSLLVHGNHAITSIHTLMNQVDPVCLREFEVKSDETDDTIFDIPHIYTTNDIYIEGSTLRDDILLKIKAKTFFSGSYQTETNHNELLTAAAINQYLKKSLLNLNEMAYKLFHLLNLSPLIDDAEVLEGLDVISSEMVRDQKKIVIDSVHPEYVLVLRCRNRGIVGCIVERNSDILSD